MPKKRKPIDPNQLAKSIVDQATGQDETAQFAPPSPQTPEEVMRMVMREMGRRGGKKGGKVRAEHLSPRKRKAIARKAAQARWGKKRP